MRKVNWGVLGTADIARGADLEAQSPAGEGGLRFFSDVTLEHRTVQNLRTGI